MRLGLQPRSRLLLHHRISHYYNIGSITPFHASKAAADDDEAVTAARKWLATFDPDSISRSICEVTFSRSSGPGGQNVNKLNTKATLRVPLDALLPRLPALLHPEIRSSRYYAAKSDSLIIQADDSRKQTDNSNAVFARLCNLIQESGRKVVPGETSEEQKRRVKELQQAQNEGRLKAKKSHSEKKSNRRGQGKSDY